jgi:hypothetical protein
VGRSPLYLRLRPGKYNVVILHPPLEDVDNTYSPEYVTVKKRGSAGGISFPIPFSYQKCPFIGPGGFVVNEGKYSWVYTREVEVGSGLKIMIGLFQRRDKHFSYLLPVLPEGRIFGILPPDVFQDFSKIHSSLSGSLPSEDVPKALDFFTRGGVFGWDLGDGSALIIEATEEDRYRTFLQPFANEWTKDNVSPTR